MRKLFSIVLIVLIGYIVYLAWNNVGIPTELSFSNPASSSFAQESEGTIIIQATVIPPTQTPYPTYTPYPTQTPYPTATPVNLIGNFGKQAKYTQAYDTWFPRLFMLAFFILLVAGVVLLVKIDTLERREKSELARRELELEYKLKIEKERVPEKSIVMNNRSSSSVSLANGSVAKSSIVFFCKKVRDFGFGESAWDGKIPSDDLKIIVGELMIKNVLGEDGWIGEQPISAQLANYVSISRTDLQ